MELREFRIQSGITIQKASEVTGVPLRTYIRYENDECYGSQMKRNGMLQALLEEFEVNETKGVLNLTQIKSIVGEVFKAYENEVYFCYLFGSYAKGKETELSDVDLCVSTSLTGLAFVGVIEELRVKLKKKVDLLRLSDMKDNIPLITEIMKDGIKIYG